MQQKQKNIQERKNSHMKGLRSDPIIYNKNLIEKTLKNIMWLQTWL